MSTFPGISVTPPKHPRQAKEKTPTDIYKGWAIIITPDHSMEKLERFVG